MATQHSKTRLRKADAGLPPSAVTQPGREGGTRSSPVVSSGFRSLQVLPSAAATHLLGQCNPTDLPDPSLGGFIPDLSLGDFTLQSRAAAEQEARCLRGTPAVPGQPCHPWGTPAEPPYPLPPRGWGEKDAPGVGAATRQRLPSECGPLLRPAGGLKA